MARLVGIDVGGTFTDIFVVDGDRITTAKVPSTPKDQSEGLVRGFKLVQATGGPTSALVHSSTVATNAIIERKGAVGGLITTRGFRDVIELGRRDRPGVYGFYGAFKPLIERRHRHEVEERIAADGSIVIPLDEDAVRKAGNALVESGVEAILIGFFHSYANPTHELRAKHILLETLPDRIYVSTSAELFPEIGEFERLATCAANSYLQPIMARYLGQLRKRLVHAGHQGSVMIMQSNGGVSTVDEAISTAISTAKSGPAAGVIAGVSHARLAGFTNVITCDMGGTSFDVSLVTDGKPVVTNDVELEFRQPLLSSMLDVVAIGAGGGSIAFVDRAGVLNVGPKSAGADPGPACYGRGGVEPTVTDANLILGRINPDRPIGTGSDLTMDLALAKRSVGERVGNPLNLTTEQAAEAVVSVVVNNMANAIRMISVERGHDPRDFVLVAFGGAGPLHVCALLREMNMPVAIIPPLPGLTCGIGCVVAPLRYEIAQSWRTPLSTMNRADMVAVFQKQEQQLRDRLSASGMPVLSARATREADMQYEGQAYTLRVTLPESLQPREILGAFEQHYSLRYGRLLAHGTPAIVTLRTNLEASHADMDTAQMWEGWAMAPGPSKTDRAQSVIFNGKAWPTPIIERRSLQPGDRLNGPALVVQEDATTLIEPDYSADVDKYGNILIRVAA